MKRVELSYLLRSLRQAAICLSFIFILLFAFYNAKAQPGTVYGDFGAGFGDYMLIDRGVVKATIIKAEKADSTNFFFRANTENWNPRWGRKAGESARRVVNTILKNSANYCASDCGEINDMRLFLAHGSYYTFIVGKNIDADNTMSILETTFQPASISSVTQSPAGNVGLNISVTVNVTMEKAVNSGERVFLRYSDDSWLSSSFIELNIDPLTFKGSAIIPGKTKNLTISYYVFTTNFAGTLNKDNCDFLSLKVNNNSNKNFEYKVEGPKVTISPDQELTVLNLNGRVLTLDLSYDTYKDNILDKNNFTLNNAPKGVTVQSVVYISDIKATLTLAYDGTLFTKDSTHFSVSVGGAELTGANVLKSNEITIKGTDPGPEVWLHLLTTVDFTYNLGEKNVLWINAEIGQQTWSSFQIGYGKKNNDTTGWKWFNAEWYENGEGSNKRVHTEINIADIKEVGDYYYAARVKAENPQPSWLWHYANDENWSPATILNAKYKITIKPVAQIPTLTIASKVLTESSLDNGTVDLTLANETFKDNILEKANFILNNVPKGVTVKSVEYKTNTTAIVTLAFDGANFDKDSTHFSVTILAGELTGGNLLKSNELIIKCDDPGPEVWLHLLTTVDFTYNLGEKNVLWINAEIGQQTWSSFQIGYGKKNNDTTGWKWLNAEWYEDGEGSNKRVHTEINIADIKEVGDYYYAARVKAENPQPSWLWHYANDENWSPATILNAKYKIIIKPVAQIPTLTIAAKVLTESTLDNSTVDLTLANETFKDNILDKANFILNNVPKGVTVKSVEYKTNTTAIVTLAFDGTNFDKDSTHFSVTILAGELTGGNMLKSNELIIKCDDPGPEVWLHLLTTVDFTYNLGEKNVQWINAEIGQQTWSIFQIGYGKKNNDTTGWKWFNAEWYEDGEGSNKRVHTEINIADIKEVGDYYYAARVKAENPQPSWLWHYANDENWSPATILNAKYKIIIKPVAQIPTLTIAAKVLTESTLDNSTVDLTLANETFKDNILDKANFILNNVPKGVTIKSVEYKTNTTAIVTLAFDGTNFDKDSTNFSVTVMGTELTATNPLISNKLTIKAEGVTPALGPNILSGRFSKDWKDYILKERGVVRAITLKSDTTDPKAPYLFRNNIVNYDDKWSGSNAPNVTRDVDTIYDGGAYYCNNCDWSKDLETALSKGNYYTFIIAELANENNTMSVLETKYEPVIINTVIKVPSANVGINQEAIVTLTLNKALSQGERVFVRYSNDKWATSKLIEINQLSEQFQGSVSIPGFAKPDTISYYAFTSNYIGDITKINVDYFTLSINNNNNNNYEYIVSDIVNFKIEGTLTYANKAQSKMKNILVYLKTDALVKLDSTYTDQNGSYIFNNVKNGKYIVDVHISTTPNLSAIQPSDALYINRYFLKIYKFTDKIFEKAADVNKDGNITPIDALFINRYFINIIKKFPSGTWYVEKEVFEVKDDNVLHNFRIIFFGDVNGSYSPAK
ncbi:MAG: hypothetical protein KA792_01035 [Bacteroidales bacterium]|nr:hypothetical protein [Bacteroidales bacterium]